MASLSLATTVTPTSSHTYSANFPQEWCIGAVPHGGFITATFMQVARTHFATTLSRQNQPHTMTLHLSFVRRTQTGPATFTVKDVKLGRGTTTIHITLSQNGQDEVLGYLTHANLAGESGVSYDTNWSLHPFPPALECSQGPAGLLEDASPTWAERHSMPYASFRRASANIRFFFPRAGQIEPSLADQWMCMRNGERFTNTSLGMVADMFPMIPEVMRADSDPYSLATERAEGQRGTEKMMQKQKGGSAFWYPTLLLNLDVKKALPEEGVRWLFVRTRAKVIARGRYDLEVVIMDEQGEVVALSHHVCMVLSSERNLAKRRSGKEKGAEGSKL